ncbi:unnamed protein product [Enterobius vermicularis]|uniref:Uncharacterized protein n=1 Tax=Enterobius vermicularis TaxID=51028 RepID=A0A0N4VHX5_ENTVE|nr:unnamed protein product [Enterobius vermicularis]
MSVIVRCPDNTIKVYTKGAVLLTFWLYSLSSLKTEKTKY